MPESEQIQATGLEMCLFFHRTTTKKKITLVYKQEATLMQRLSEDTGRQGRSWPDKYV